MDSKDYLPRTDHARLAKKSLTVIDKRGVLQREGVNVAAQVQLTLADQKQQAAAEQRVFQQRVFHPPHVPELEVHSQLRVYT
eukprot:3068212-Amphidinium_carterae.1